MKRLVLFSFILFSFLVLGALGFLYFSIPGPKTFHMLSQIREPVQVEWDAAGVPVIQSADIQDAYFIQGYLMARERFFQMDLIRRKMSGRLSELFGPSALESDLTTRKWGYSKAIQLSFSGMDPSKRESLISYANGVNSFLKTESRPWEYWILGLKPAQWHPEDTFLVVLSMYDSLNRHQESDEEALSILKSKLLPSVVSFLTPDWGFLDAPILKDSRPLTKPRVPQPQDFRVKETEAFNSTLTDDFEPGSNAWAISGKLTSSGKPMLASDPHLDLRVPNLWYRLGIRTPSNFVYGVGIPGIPGIVIGRNNQLAWAFTNSAIDNSDQVILPPNSPIFHREEEILIKGQAPHRAVFKDSPWGPVIEETERQAIAIQWTALDPMNLKNLDLTAINQSKNTKELIEALGQWAGPPQNAVFVSKEGDIGWTIAGNLPKRNGFDGKSRETRSSAIRWDGFVPRKDFPLILNPPEGFIVSANQRTVPAEPSMAKFGYHWPNAARAKRIENLLKTKRPFRAKDFLKIQTDNVSLTHLWYRDEIFKCPWDKLDAKDSAWLKPAFTLLKEWDGKTSVLSSAYPLLKRFRAELFNNLISPISKTVSLSQDDIILKYLSQDNLVTQLLTIQPNNFLSIHFSSYCDAIKSSLRQAAQSLASSPEELKTIQWGNLNKSDIQHPFARLLPKTFRSLISMPSRAMGGDSLVPNVMTPRNGASMRLIVDFSDPSESLFSQPGGQSGHPLSSHYSDLFYHWIEGTGAPFEFMAINYHEKFIPKRINE